MYQHNSRQLEIEDFKTPFRTPLDSNNRWVKLAALIPWDYVEKQYKKKLGRAREGKRAYSSRLAFGALIIKERLRLTDEETVAMITENHYLQWFIGFQEFQIKAPFNDSLMTHFRLLSGRSRLLADVLFGKDSRLKSSRRSIIESARHKRNRNPMMMKVNLVRVITKDS